VRFRPGAAADVLGLHGSELADARVGVSELWGRTEMERLESRLAASRSPLEVSLVLEDIVASHVHAPPDPTVEAVVAVLASPRTRVLALAEQIGLSERQLLRRCTSALGYGPKMLDRILRFQRFCSLGAGRGRVGLAELAFESGYADQSHLTRECKQLAGRTPASVLGQP
jgi:AraC-like DNA-binding protein